MQRSALCRSRRELSNAYLLAKFGFDTAENEPLQVCPLSAYRSPRWAFRRRGVVKPWVHPGLELYYQLKRTIFSSLVFIIEIQWNSSIDSQCNWAFSRTPLKIRENQWKSRRKSWFECKCLRCRILFRNPLQNLQNLKEKTFLLIIDFCDLIFAKSYKSLRSRKSYPTRSLFRWVLPCKNRFRYRRERARKSLDHRFRRLNF